MPKRIILLSDGTGNAVKNVWRTNVWRVFEALDLAQPDQVACYADGVGTSSFKPLAILGGVFGWGLKRNVLHLYKFLCRNHESDAEIYAFGFSRGAFTIRVLAGLIAHQGIVPFKTESELDRYAKAAYRAYRAERYHSLLRIEKIGRLLRDGIVRLIDLVAAQDALFRNRQDSGRIDPLRRRLGHGGRLWPADRRDDARRQPVAVAARTARSQAEPDHRSRVSCAGAG